MDSSNNVNLVKKFYYLQFVRVDTRRIVQFDLVVPGTNVGGVAHSGEAAAGDVLADGKTL